MINVEYANPLENVYEDGGTTTLKFNEIPYYDGDPYDLMDDKSFKQYMKNLEYIVRNSYEYRSFIGYLRNIEGMNKCSVLNITSEQESKVKIELHHTPLTLYDICLTVLRKREANNESIKINDVAEEVMYLHYIGWVGLVPLCSTVHETVHTGYLFIPTNIVRGNYKAFIDAYHDYIEPETLDAIASAEQATVDGLYDERKVIFNNHKIYIDVNGSSDLSWKSDAKQDLYNHIDEVKGKKPVNNKKVMFRVIDKTKT